ncbi:MAG: hypothetical protein RBU27_02830 [Bacteroidota bacterium]|jgi:hypothetical protein|nr:hypothetical protein [Bacteroidota bacterium]
MRHGFIFFLLVTLLPGLVLAQFRGEEPGPPSVRDGVYRNTESNAILGFFHPENLEMRHSVSVSYGSVGDQGVGISMYTNSLRYRISEPLSVRADVAMMFSPFGSMSSRFQQDLSGIFLRRASIDYRPGKNMHISLQYRNDPYAVYGPYSGSRGSIGGYGVGGFGFGGGMFFDDWDDEDRP